MPVSCVFPVEDSADVFVKRILNLPGASKIDPTDNWNIVFKTFVRQKHERQQQQHDPNNPKKLSPTMTIATFSENKGMCYTDIGKDVGIVESTEELEHMVNMLSGIFKLGRTIKIQGKFCIEIADFVVKVGNVIDQQGGQRGTVVEVEYGPCASEVVCSSFVTDFVQHVICEQASNIIWSSSFGEKSPKQFGHRNLITEYLTFLRNKKLLPS
eukprot:m.56174 g.56174  ORF g.56174 m.56174 type:complete len:212 (-) comp22200_c0_seq2:90-725(-)